MNAITQQEITMISTPRTCNTHNNADAYKLTRWIEVNQESLKNKTQEQISELASEGTDLLVTVNNVQGVAKTLGIPLGLYSRKPIASNDNEQVLARSICGLYRALGLTAPASVNDIANRGTL